ncbi:hypothetical protein IQ06DRAFT_302947 [Phaeosphaeriaceae sp. SRC1lsM3a]|nr:hypothetical protein IQ06DRAFT_302947 [Stagonospora sp. SRC1lsM3a]
MWHILYIYRVVPHIVFAHQSSFSPTIPSAFKHFCTLQNPAKQPRSPPRTPQLTTQHISKTAPKFVPPPYHQEITMPSSRTLSPAATLPNANISPELPREGIESARDSLELMRPVYKEKAKRKRERKEESREKERKGFGWVVWLIKGRK